MRTLRLIGTFYRSFIFASSIITLSSISIIYTNGISVLAILFWFKIITLGLIVYFINTYKSKEIYYYKNFGLSKLFLWGSTLLIDMFLFIILLILTLKLK